MYGELKKSCQFNSETCFQLFFCVPYVPFSTQSNFENTDFFKILHNQERVLAMNFNTQLMMSKLLNQDSLQTCSSDLKEVI